MDLDIRRCVESIQYEGRHRQGPVDVYPRGGQVWFDDQRWWTVPPRKTDRVERGFDRRYVQRAPDTLPAPPSVGDTVTLRDHGGYTRVAEVVEVDGPLFEATYALKSKQWRCGWFDVVALRAGS